MAGVDLAGIDVTTALAVVSEIDVEMRSASGASSPSPLGLDHAGRTRITPACS
jgi:hypothetical protein